MQKYEVVQYMGRFPDKINPKEKMLSKIWKCSKCGRIYRFNNEVENPAPCSECGSIFFETIKCK